MRRKLILRSFGVLVVLAFGTYVYLELQWQPKITKVTEPVVLEPGMRMSYFFHHHDPFRDDLVWIKPFNPKRPVMKQYLFDLKKEKVTHVADNVEMVQVNRSYNTTLGSSFGSLRLFLRWKIQKLMGIREEHQDEFYFTLDIYDHNSVVKTYLNTVNSIIENSYLSPDGRYAKINVIRKEQYVLYYREKTLIELPASANSWEGGWLSNHECFYRDQRWNVCVYDVNKMESTVILTPTQLTNFLAEHDLQINKSMLFTVRTVPTKDGDRMIINSNSYLDWDNGRRVNVDEAWVVELDRESRELLLHHKVFPHHGAGKWNADLTKYVFWGDGKTTNTSAVLLYDVVRDEMITLVTGREKQYTGSMPNFYGDQVIYIKENAVWIVNDDGTGKRQLFPPANE